MPDAHEVAWAVGRQDLIDDFDGVVHRLGRLADGEPADGVALGAELRQSTRALATHVREDGALDDGEECLVVTVARLRGAVVREGTLGPADRPRVRPGRLGGVHRRRRQLVEHHHDVGADVALRVHDRLGREKQRVAVEVALEADAVLGDLADVGEREHLEAAGVGQNGAVPAHEPVQAAVRAQHLASRPQRQMVGVAQDDLRADVVGERPWRDALDGTQRADGHERSASRSRRDPLSGGRRARRSRGTGPGARR